MLHPKLTKLGLRIMETGNMNRTQQITLRVALVAVGCAALFGQTAVFEVASVRVSPPPAPNQRVFFGPPRGGPGTDDPGEITWTAASFVNILMTAFDLQGFQIKAPEWALTTRYDIVAKVPAGTTRPQVRVMWQNLLRDRFHLAVHRESKEFQVLELTVAKGGLKIKETDLPSTAEPFDFGAGTPKIGPNGTLEMNGTGSVVTIYPTATGANARLAAKGFTMAELAARLGGWTTHPIIDRTGLTGRYDFVLEFTPDASRLAATAVSRACSRCRCERARFECSVCRRAATRVEAH